MMRRQGKLGPLHYALLLYLLYFIMSYSLYRSHPAKQRNRRVFSPLFQYLYKYMIENKVYLNSRNIKNFRKILQSNKSLSWFQG